MTRKCFLCGTHFTKESSITFHRFPMKPEEQYKWLEKLDLVGQILPDESYICSQHFSPDCFSKLSRRTRLIRGSLPTLNLHKINEETEDQLEDNNENEICLLISTAKDFSKSFPLENKHSDELYTNHNKTTIWIETDNNVDTQHCITCWTTNGDNYFSITNKIYLDTTIKEMILLLVPEMATLLQDRHRICTDCKNILDSCSKFISQCHFVQIQLIAGVYQEPNKDSRIIYDDFTNKYQEENVKNENLEINAEQNEVTIPEDPKQYQEEIEEHENIKIEIDGDHYKELIHVYIKEEEEEKEDDKEEYLKYESLESYEEVNIEDENINMEIEFDKKSESKSLRKISTKCEECNIEFKSKRQFIKHNKSHTSKESQCFLCEICGKYFTLKYKYILHKNIHRDYVCEVCHSVFDNRGKFITHSYSHQENGFECDRCSKKFRNPFILKKHIRRIHVQEKEKNIQVQCIECRKLLKRSSLDVHMRTMHSKLGPIQCPECTKQFAAPRYLRLHIKSVHRKIRKNNGKINNRFSKLEGYSPEELLPCKICGKHFKGLHLLKGHIKLHNEPRYSCSQCGMTIKSINNLRKHEKTHLDKRNLYRCNVCWKRFQSTEEVKQHMVIHDKLKYRYQCNECEKYFHTKFLLNNHMYVEHPTTEDLEWSLETIVNDNIKALNEDRQKMRKLDDDCVKESE